MRAIAKRIERLEGRFSPREDLADYQARCMLYERRRRRFAAEGVPFLEPPPEPHVGPILPLTPADILRLRREGRRAREAREAALGAAHSTTKYLPIITLNAHEDRPCAEFAEMNENTHILGNSPKITLH